MANKYSVLGKRGSKERIIGWSKLQEIMLAHGMINKRQALMNKLYIRAYFFDLKEDAIDYMKSKNLGYCEIFEVYQNEK